MLNLKELVGLRKVCLKYIQYLPIIQSIIYFSATMMNVYVQSNDWVNYIFGISFNSLLLYYVIGIYQKWCWKFRLCVYYLLINLCISFIDYLFTIPITDIQYGYLTISIFISFLLYYLIRKKYDKCNNDGV